MQHAFGLDIPGTLAEMCDPRKMAVLVYDMQAGIIRQIPNGAKITGKVAQVLAAARAGGYRVFFSRYMTLPKEVAGAFQLRMAMAWQHVASPDEVRCHFHRDSPGFQLVPEVAALPTEAVFDRITMSAFEGSPLNIALRDCGITCLAIVGVATEIGIEPTVRHAADLGYIPVIITDACGAGHAEAAARSIETLRFLGDAVLTDVQSVCPLLAGEGSEAALTSSN